MSFFAQDAVYHNIPVPPVKGAGAIRAAFLGFVELMDSIDLDVLAIAAHGNICSLSASTAFAGRASASTCRSPESSRLAVARSSPIATTSITRRNRYPARVMAETCRERQGSDTSFIVIPAFSKQSRRSPENQGRISDAAQRGSKLPQW